MCALLVAWGCGSVSDPFQLKKLSFSFQSSLAPCTGVSAIHSLPTRKSPGPWKQVSTHSVESLRGHGQPGVAQVEELRLRAQGGEIVWPHS